MEEDLLEPITDEKIYTIKTIITCTFLGGLLSGAYMLYKNFKVFGDNKKASWTIVIALLSLIALVATSLIPALENVPNIVYAIIITGATSFFAKKYQEDLVKKHIEKSGNLFTTGNAVLVCIVSILIIVLPLILIFILQDNVI